MIRQLLRNGQVTLPKQATSYFHLKTRDLLDVSVDRFGIHIKPVALQEFSEDDYAKLAKCLDALKARGGRRVYKSTQSARLHLDRLMRP